MPASPEPPLTGFRVLEVAMHIAGPYAGKLLADAGADVVKVEPSSGDPLRTWTASGTPAGHEGSALFQFLNTSKRSIVAPPDSDDVRTLAAAADIVLVDDGVADAALHRLREVTAGRSCTVVSVTPFGRTGPAAGSPATEFTLQARCGSTAGRGLPASHPLAAGGRLGEFIGGAYAAVAGLAYAQRARDTGSGEFLDLSLLEGMVITMGGLSSVAAQTLGPAAPSGRSLELPSIEPTADGYVGFCTITAQQLQDFLVLIERFDWLGDAQIAALAGRQRRREEFCAAVREWTTKRTTAEILEAAAALRIPVAPIGSPDNLTQFDHFAERGVFVTNPGGFLQPRPPYRIVGAAPRPLTPAPAAGEHDGAISWEPTERGSTPASGADAAPLDGLRIMDLTAFWAGPSATWVLGALGADVIKVEGVKRPDGIRYAGSWPPSRESWWETGSVFLAVNHNKRDLAIELTTERGREIARTLIAHCDVVIENFSPRVMPNLGLDAQAVAAANPEALLVRMPAFGLDGPWRDRVGFAQTMEQVSGMAWLTGDAEGPPIIPRGACDPIAGLHAAFATLVALQQRRRHGGGGLVEVPMVEAALNVAAAVVVERSAYGRSLMRDGNRGPVASPQGVYRCSGNDAWVAIATASDAQWRALCEALAAEELGGDKTLQTATGRRAAADRVDAVINAWTATRSTEQVVATLRRYGIAVEAVTAAAELVHDEQLCHRGFFESVDHPVVGSLQMPSQPLRLGASSRRWLRTAAPTLGQHNDAILHGLLGLDPAELDRLREAKVIGTRPAGL